MISESIQRTHLPREYRATRSCWRNDGSAETPSRRNCDRQPPLGTSPQPWAQPARHYTHHLHTRTDSLYPALILSLLLSAALTLQRRADLSRCDGPAPLVVLATVLPVPSLLLVPLPPLFPHREHHKPARESFFIFLPPKKAENFANGFPWMREREWVREWKRNTHAHVRREIARVGNFMAWKTCPPLRASDSQSRRCFHSYTPRISFEREREMEHVSLIFAHFSSGALALARAPCQCPCLG